MDRVETSVDTFLAGLAEPTGSQMRLLDDVISAAMPARSRTLWEGPFWGGTFQQIIGYGDLVQRRPRGDDVEWFVVGLAQQKRGLSIYVNAVDGGRYLGHAYADRLGRVRLGSASIALRTPDDVDLDVLAELVAHADRLSPPDPG